MELGLYTFGEVAPDPATRRAISPQQRMRDLLEEVELADQVGLDVFGVGEHHRPDFVVSFHDSSDLEAGTIAYAPGFAMANTDAVNITVRGVGGHGAMPDHTKDPVVLAAETVLALQTIVSRGRDGHSARESRRRITEHGRVDRGSRSRVHHTSIRPACHMRAAGLQAGAGSGAVSAGVSNVVPLQGAKKDKSTSKSKSPPKGARPGNFGSPQWRMKARTRMIALCPQ